ncbi:MAG: hypothetical protein IT221_10955 [Fluviicola sp.]|nr:hypothetical protein [Fluviicola sp.]
MKAIPFILFLLTFSTFHSFSQVEEEEDTELYIQDEEDQNEKVELDHNYELGVDVFFNAGTFGGTAGAGLKFGFVKGENWLFGPSVRYQKSWYKNLGLQSSWSFYGGGAFVHYRMYNYFYLGGEFEFLSTPFNQTALTLNLGKRWVPTFLVGGGFSRAFGPNFRMNAGIMYDIINHPNSPFRQGYFMRKENGTLIPLMYRITFFISI